MALFTDIVLELLENFPLDIGRVLRLMHDGALAQSSYAARKCPETAYSGRRIGR
jgi:hypothetical protein